MCLASIQYETEGEKGGSLFQKRMGKKKECTYLCALFNVMDLHMSFVNKHRIQSFELLYMVHSVMMLSFASKKISHGNSVFVSSH